MSHRLLISLLVAVMVLAGCSGGDPEPILAPSAPPTPTPSATASEPPAAETETPEDFIRRWNDVDIQMQNSGDTSEYRGLTPRCVPCRNLAERIDTIYQAGGEVMTDGWRILKIVRESPPGDKRGAYRVWVESRPTVVTEAKGASEERLPGGEAQYKVDVVRAGGQWTILYFSMYFS